MQPILNILVTKSLEQAVLELEEEQEIENMVEFKKAFVKRKCLKSDEDWKKIIEVEMDMIDTKETMISDLRFVELKQQNLSLKIKSHHLAGNYLRDVVTHSVTNLRLR